MLTLGLDYGANSVRALVVRCFYDSFGGLTRAADLTRVMKDLIEITYAQR